MMGKIQVLSDEIMVLILSYLRATDLGHISITDTSVMSTRRVSYAVNFLIKETFLSCAGAVNKRNSELPVNLMSPSVLFATEINCILSAINSPQPTSNKGYWISAAWLSDARKYYESLTTLDISRSNKRSPTKEIKRRISPQKKLPVVSLCMTSDITCPHNGLPRFNCKSKRRMIDTNAWHFLRRLFPQGHEHKANAKECFICEDIFTRKRLEMEAISAAKVATTPSTKSSIQLVPPPLRSLFIRRSGVPQNSTVDASNAGSSSDSAVSSPGPQLDPYLLDFMTAEDIADWIAAVELAASQDESEEQATSSSTISQRLVPGIYNVVPRQWLRQWRRSFTGSVCTPVSSQSPVSMLSNALNPSSAPPPLDCTSMLCHAHGLLVVPPHLEEYLIGLRRTLLGGLGQYPGEVVEVLRDDEWEALTGASGSRLEDFSVRFCLDGENISWNLPLCDKCDRFNRGVATQR